MTLKKRATSTNGVRAQSISIRVNNEEKESIESAANKKGVNTSEFIAVVALKEAARINKS